MQEPIAIVGYSLKFPGEATSPAAFWRMLEEKRCAVNKIPKDRFSASGSYHPDGGRHGVYSSQGGHFLEEDVTLFDAPFFNFSEEEAISLDPAQRHLLELTYVALENAGIPIEKTTGSRASVHVGSSHHDFRLLSSKDIESSPDHDILGNLASFNPNLLSWFFGFNGPSVNIDTACSSSLVALVMACQGLLSGDVDMAVAAGANLILSPDMYHVYSNLNMLGPDSRSYSFDHRAKGYGRGEGTGVLIIKRLADAIQNGDTIRAVIRSASSNHDGWKAGGIFRPGSEGQLRLIEETYAKAAVSKEPTRYFEAHGTGTSVGDPIEVDAIGTCFRDSRSTDDPLYVGSVKSNIGHLEAASGVAAVIKVIMILESGIILPNTNFERLNPKIDSKHLRVKVPTNAIPWPSTGLRRASVNSFGLGGSNAHLILDDALNYLKAHRLSGRHSTIEQPRSIVGNKQPNGIHGAAPVKLSTPQLVMISAYDEAAVSRTVTTLTTSFKDKKFRYDTFGSYVGDLAHTLNTRRTIFSRRCFLTVSTPDDLRNLDKRVSPVMKASGKTKVAFVFTGQGAQYSEMGKELLKYPVFKNSLEMSGRYLEEHGESLSLQDELMKDNKCSRINLPELSQTATTAIQIAVVDLLESIGVRPAAIVGHSSGEIAAAYALGALSAAEAVFIAYARGQCIAQLATSCPQSGSMLAAGLSENQARDYIERVAKHYDCRSIDIACVNSQRSVTISGDVTQIDALKDMLDSEKIFARKLKVPVAYHSNQMTLIADQYRVYMEQGIKVRENLTQQGSMVSSVTGSTVSINHLRSPDYWVRNLVSTVQFAQAFSRVCSDSSKHMNGSVDLQPAVNLIIEIGPHAALEGPIRDMLETVPRGSQISYFATMRRGRDGIETFLQTVGNLYCLGASVDLRKVNRLGSPGLEASGLLTDLPGYPFNHSKSYWRESRISSNFRSANQGKLDLLGRPVVDWNHLEARWRNHLRISEMPWMEDHVVNGIIVYPPAGMIVMAIEAANQVADSKRTVKAFKLRNVKFLRPLIVPRTVEGVETHLLLRKREHRSATSWSEFRVFSYENKTWQENCSGSIAIQYENKDDHSLLGTNDGSEFWRIRDREIRDSCTMELSSGQLYKALNERGLSFGSTFKTIESGQYSADHQVRAPIKVFKWPPEQHPQPHILHPTTLDGVLHTALAALSRGGTLPVSHAIPTSIRKLRISRNGLNFSDSPSILASTWSNYIDSRGCEFTMCALDDSCKGTLMEIEGFHFAILAPLQNQSLDQSANILPCHHLKVVPDLTMMKPLQLYNYCSTSETASGRNQANYFRELDFVLFKFLYDACKALGDGVYKRPAHLDNFVGWAKLHLRKFVEGTSTFGCPEWKDWLEDKVHFEGLCNRLAATNDHGYAFVEVGRNLLPILKGEQDPLQFLFRDDMMARFYTEMNKRRCFDEWDIYLKACADKKPTMKILEIGAGTGGTSDKVLRCLNPSSEDSLYASYDYTDISPAFFEQAREKFSNYPRMHFKVLNIENDPAAQGFEVGSYDLIIAANVLHATPNIHQTLQNVRRLLKPRGQLMMYEIVLPDIIRSNFIAGLISGWWLSEEKYRSWGPTMSTSLWHTIFEQTGYSGVDLEFLDFEEPVCRECSIMVTTAKEEVQSPSVGTVAFVLNVKSDEQQAIFRRVRDMLLSYNPSLAVQDFSLEAYATIAKPDHLALVVLHELDTPLLSNIDSESFDNVQRLVESNNRIVWVTAADGYAPAKAEYSMADGYLRTLGSEKLLRHIVKLDLDVKGKLLRDEQIQHILKTIDVVLNVSDLGSYEPELIEVDGILHVPRLVEDTRLSDQLSKNDLLQPSTISFGEAGPIQLTRIDDLQGAWYWIRDDHHEVPLKPREVEIEVRTSAFDAQAFGMANGRSHDPSSIQVYAGSVTRVGEVAVKDFQLGDKVATFCPGAPRSFIRSETDFVYRLQDSIPFIEAVNILKPAAVAWEAVFELGRLREGESLFVQNVSTDIGRIAIKIAYHVGAKVYTAVGSRPEQETLVNEYRLPLDCIFDSKDTSLTEAILSKTKNQGCDVVLNGEAGDCRLACWDCVSPYGRLIDLSVDGDDQTMRAKANASVISFDGHAWLRERPARAKAAVNSILELYAKGKLHSTRYLPIKSVSEIDEVLNIPNSSNPNKASLIDFNLSSFVSALLPKPNSYTLDNKATYLIAGGLGTIGLVLAQWLVSGGAKHLVLLSRRGPRTPSALSLLSKLRSEGVAIATPHCDLISPGSVSSTLSTLSAALPPIKGCFQSAMVLRGRAFARMSHAEWREAVECKALGTAHLHRYLPAELDFFICLSSVDALLGLPGHANYAAGNAYMDALSRHCAAPSPPPTPSPSLSSHKPSTHPDTTDAPQRKGLVSLALGPLAPDLSPSSPDSDSPGKYLAGDAAANYGLLGPGITRTQLERALSHYCDPAVNRALTPETAHVVLGLRLDPAKEVAAQKNMLAYVRLEEIAAAAAKQNSEESATNSAAGGTNGNRGSPDWRALLGAAKTKNDVEDIVLRALVWKLAQTNRIPSDCTGAAGDGGGATDGVDRELPLWRFGVDSLLAVGICNWTGRELGAEVGSGEVMAEDMGLGKLAGVVGGRSGFVKV